MTSSAAISSPPRPPGVYRSARPRARAYPRVRTDVVGFVGFLGSRRVHEVVLVDDWREFEQAFLVGEPGSPADVPSGSQIVLDVRAYFNNGGRTAAIVNVGGELAAPPTPHARNAKRSELAALLLGLPVSPDALGHQQPPPRAWGLTKLIDSERAAVVVISGLNARWTVKRTLPAPYVSPGAGFHPCHGAPEPKLASSFEQVEPLFSTSNDDTTTYDTSINAAIDACAAAPTPCFLLLTPPPALGTEAACAWADHIRAGAGVESESCAVYWPWVRAELESGSPTPAMSPLGFVAGSYAAADHAEGPGRAAANDPLVGIVGAERALLPSQVAQVVNHSINPIVAAPQRGFVAYGARTLAWVPQGAAPLHAPHGRAAITAVPVRRMLSAIMQTARQIGQTSVFEPNDLGTQLELGQVLFGYLLRLFEVGVLLGTTEEQAFFIRPISPLPVAESALGFEIGVAIAQPAEFLVFRLGRRGGNIGTPEATA